MQNIFGVKQYVIVHCLKVFSSKRNALFPENDVSNKVFATEHLVK